MKCAKQEVSQHNLYGLGSSCYELILKILAYISNLTRVLIATKLTIILNELYLGALGNKKVLVIMYLSSRCKKNDTHTHAFTHLFHYDDNKYTYTFTDLLKYKKNNNAHMYTRSLQYDNTTAADTAGR